MVNITLPDGAVKSFNGSVSGFDVAMSISEGLAKATYAMKVNGTQTDINSTITTDSTVELITKASDEGLEIMRHTVAAQVLAKAIKNLYPAAKLVIGPTIDNGFYYDIDLDERISENDFEKIETEMKNIVKEKTAIRIKQVTKAEAIEVFKARNEDHKIDILNKADDFQALFNLYYQGESDDAFVDLCRGPHLPDLGKVGEFKLLKISGSYLNGDSSQKQLQRIYGTAFLDKKALTAHLTMLEEAERRDHRKIGKQMDLFHLQPECPGQVFWHDKGWKIFLKLQEYIREKLGHHHYQEVNTPQLVSKDLYIASGHWDKFGTGEMFISEAYGKEHALKPMNCPCHVQIFNSGLKSYRDLPIRMSEFGTCMRHESSGSLHGIMRVSSMTQDDAHIFCTPAQVEDEVQKMCDLIKEIYSDFGFNEVKVMFSTRPEMRVGSDEIWDKAEADLAAACKKVGLEYEIQPGEGAFYGPKLEFTLFDAIGRGWQCGTIQLDFNLPGRLGAEYVDENNEKQQPVMIHRALLGSLERFTGILVENFVGNFPLWIAPVQIALTGIVDKHNDAVIALEERLKNEGFRVISDLRNEKVNYKIREHSHNKVSVIGVLGDKEIENNQITVRRLGSNDQTTMDIEDFIYNLKQEVITKALPPFKS
jgi:threonyl-tRNA synthetase